MPAKFGVTRVTVELSDGEHTYQIVVDKSRIKEPNQFPRAIYFNIDEATKASGIVTPNSLLSFPSAKELIDGNFKPEVRPIATGKAPDVQPFSYELAWHDEWCDWWMMAADARAKEVDVNAIRFGAGLPLLPGTSFVPPSSGVAPTGPSVTPPGTGPSPIRT